MSQFQEHINGHVVIPGNYTAGGGTTNYNFGPTPRPDGSSRAREPVRTVPFAPDPDFVDRPDILEWIHGKCTRPGARAALVGLGGVGKSQLAIQYAHKVRDAAPQTSVFWVHAGTRARFDEAYRGLAEKLALPGRDDPKVDILRLVSDWMSDESNGQWIMIVDNADDAETFFPVQQAGQNEQLNSLSSSPAAYLPQSCNGRILVTSRNKDVAAKLVGGYHHTREVPTMDESQGLQLLCSKLQDTPTAEDAAELLIVLDYLPLAITQAAAYINRGARTTISRYLEQFRANGKKRENLLNWDAGDLRRDPSASNSVVTTWRVSFERIRQERPSAADLLSLMSFFNPQGIPEWVLRRYGSKATSIGDQDEVDSAFDEDLNILHAYSLIGVIADADMCEMHPLVQFCTRVWLSSVNHTDHWRHEFVVLMAQEFPDGTFENQQRCQQLLPHVEPLYDEPTSEEWVEEWAQILTNAAGHLRLQGKYGTAQTIATKAVTTIDMVLGSDNTRILQTVSLLALILSDQGKYKAAEMMNRRALEGYEKALGKDHSHTLISVSNLALVLQSQGKYEAAEVMNRQALEEYEKMLGKNHPRTLTCVNNLALILRDQGKYEASEIIGRRALEGSEEVLGKDHPDTLTTVNNLALVLHDQGKYEAAEMMNRRALEGREKVLGENHPKTLASVNNLALTLQSQGKHEAAEVMNRQALEGREKVVGKDHPDTLNSIHTLVVGLQDQGKYEAAEVMARRMVEGREKVLGEDHPKTLNSIHTLALVLQDQGKYEAAEVMMRRVVEGYEKVLEKDHPNMLHSIHTLAVVLRDQGKYEAAGIIMQQAVDRREKVLGENHLDTLHSIHWLARIFHHQRRLDSARDAYQRACDGYEQTHGFGHPTTIACQNDFAALKRAVGAQLPKQECLSDDEVERGTDENQWLSCGESEEEAHQDQLDKSEASSPDKRVSTSDGMRPKLASGRRKNSEFARCTRTKVVIRTKS